MSEDKIELPPVGMTLLPPWGALIVLANKRNENRVARVASEAKRWTGGLIAITSSKNYDEVEAREAAQDIGYDAATDPPVEDAIRAVRFLQERLPPGKGYVADRLDAWIRARSGCIIGVAELVGVNKNWDYPPGYWQVPNQWSLALGRVWEVEPVPCTGGPGVFRLGRCSRCDRPIALTYDTKCKRCPGELTYPKALTVKAVYGPDGEVL